MVCCAAFGCLNRTDKRDKTLKLGSPKISFHQFPKDSKIKQMWVDAVGRKNWPPSPRSVLCSAHFSNDSFDRTSINITRLWKNAVPTIFPPLPAYLQKGLPYKRIGRKRILNIKDLSQNYLPLSSDHNYCSLSFYNFVAVKEDQLETTASASSTSSSATLLHHIKTEEEDPLNLDEKPTFEDMESHLCDIPIKIERDNFEDVIRRDEEFDESAPGPSGIHCFSIKNEIIEEPWQCCEGNADPEFETVFCDTVKLEVELGDVVIKSDVDS